jgi:exodeoxyribonuclease VIII
MLIREVMVDLETLDTGPDAHILSIGAVAMHNHDQTFYSIPGTGDQGRAVDDGTIDWWLEQPEAARNEVLIDTGITLEQSLKDFIEFFKDVGATRVWSHGVDFDVVILIHAFKQHGLRPPWFFTNVEHTRTLISTAQRLKNKTFEPDRGIVEGNTFGFKATNTGTHHNALDDALFQAQWMNAIWEGFK